MASKTIEEILKNMPAESRAAIEEMSPETRSAVQQTGLGLQKQGIAEKLEYQETARRGAQTWTTEPSEQMPKQEQRGAAKIQLTKSHSQEPRTATQEKTSSEKTFDKER